MQSLFKYVAMMVVKRSFTYTNDKEGRKYFAANIVWLFNLKMK